MNTTIDEQRIHSMVESFGVAWVGTVSIDNKVERVKAFKENERKQAFEWCAATKNELKGKMAR